MRPGLRHAVEHRHMVQTGIAGDCNPGHDSIPIASSSETTRPIYRSMSSSDASARCGRFEFVASRAHDGLEPVGEGVLRRGADADVGLHAGDDHPCHFLLSEEQCEVGGEEGAEATLVDGSLVRSGRPELAEESRVMSIFEMMNRQFLPLEIGEVGTVFLGRVDHDACRRPAPRPAELAWQESRRRHPGNSSGGPVRRTS